MNLFNLKRFRQDFKLTQTQLAEILHIPQSSVCAMEKGRTRVSDSYINLLVERFGINRVNYEEGDTRSSIYIRSNGGNNNGMYNNYTEPAIIEQIKKAQEMLMHINDQQSERIKYLEEQNKVLQEKLNHFVSENAELRVTIGKSSC